MPRVQQGRGLRRWIANIGGSVAGYGLEGNSAGADGGGVYSDGGTLSIGQVDQNTAANGGGVFVDGNGIATIGTNPRYDEVSSNVAQYGGGIYVNTNASVTIAYKVYVDGNIAMAAGGAGGGGVWDLGKLTNNGNVVGNQGGNIEP